MSYPRLRGRTSTQYGPRNHRYKPRPLPPPHLSPEDREILRLCNTLVPGDVAQIMEISVGDVYRALARAAVVRPDTVERKQE